jgi:pyruvate dehydrogenase E1 component alpha subunit
MTYLDQMMTIRRMETSAGELYRAKKIRGFCHLYSGQEALCVGMRAASTDDDSYCSAYRVHGWAYVMGRTVKEVMGELIGSESGCSLGKGGSMHMYTDRFFGGNGIVGAQVPITAGLALANQYLDNKTMAVGLYGDGASNQGQVFEAYNMAKLWNLPCLFVCENNKYGMGTSAERSSSNTSYYTRGLSCNVPGLWVDAMDILSVKAATAWAREYTIEHGPLVVEMETYRYHGHSMSDPDTTYRERSEIAEMRKIEDPIIKLKQTIIDAGWSDEKELKAMEKEIRKKVDTEVAAAQAVPQPPMSHIANHILDGEPITVRGCDVTLEYSSTA